jgi:D-3-phosphoglycerate dehydrogenase
MALVIFTKSKTLLMSVNNATSYPKEKIKIMLLENVHQVAVEKFHAAGYKQVIHLKKALDEHELIKAIEQVHILGIRSKTQVSSNVLRNAKKLQSVGCFCIGTNQVNMQDATGKGIAVFNAPYSNTRSVAELVIGASIMLIRKVLEKNQAAHQGFWFKQSDGSRELRGKTMGIIGYGNIGSQLSVLAEALGMKVLYYDIESKLPLGNAFACSSLKELLQKSDLVTLHVPELPTTKNLITKNQLRWMKPGSILINYSRGEVVDLDALAKSLQDGHIAGAAIDVFPIEPEKNGDQFSCPLQGIPNVLLTPHIGGSTEEAQFHIGADVADKMLQYLETGNTYGSLTIPPLLMPAQEGTHRILHIHKNVPGVMSQLNQILSDHKVNILGQYLKTNEKIGYAVLDVNKKINPSVISALNKEKEAIRVRLLY